MCLRQDSQGEVSASNRLSSNALPEITPDRPASRFDRPGVIFRPLTDDDPIHLTGRGRARTVAIITPPVSTIAPFPVVSPVTAVVVAIVPVPIVRTIIDARRVVSTRPISTVIDTSAQDAN